MSHRKPIKLTWEGVEYKTIVNMNLIGRIDDEIGILKLMQMKSKEPKIFVIVQLVHILLEEAGAVVMHRVGNKNVAMSITVEEVWDGLGDKADPKDLFNVLAEITPMLLPNFAGLAKKKPVTRKRAKKKA